MKFLRKIFVPMAVVIIGLCYTGAHLSDSVATSGNTFQAGVWGTGPAVLINEIYSNPLDGEIEWIELINKTASDLSLSGFTVEDNNASPRSLSTLSIPANGYLVLNKGVDFSFAMNNPGDILILKKEGTTIDGLTYGTYNDGNLADNAPAPALGESLARIPNGKDTNVDILDFQVKEHSAVTPGGPNV